jgi:hypothetical protein
MVAAPTPEDIRRDARWLAQAFDPASGLVRLAEMDRAAYRAASFLDDRLLQAPIVASVMPMTEVAAAMLPDDRRDARWIFHIGHVGSTLIARLLGELEAVLAVREPRLLRDFASLSPGARAPLVPAVQALYSRTFAADQTALVKTTSFVSEIAAELVPAGGRALMLTTSPETYIATILAGENSAKELPVLAASRAARMKDRVPALTPVSGNLAQLAAAAWACEASALEAAAARIGDDALFMDFDRFLDDMTGSLRMLADFFGFAASDEALAAIVAGPLPTRYSKAMEYDYGPSLRAQLLEQARDEHRQTLTGALVMLHEAARNAPLRAAALGRSRSY